MRAFDVLCYLLAACIGLFIPDNDVLDCTIILFLFSTLRYILRSVMPASAELLDILTARVLLLRSRRGTPDVDLALDFALVLLAVAQVWQTYNKGQSTPALFHSFRTCKANVP